MSILQNDLINYYAISQTDNHNHIGLKIIFCSFGTLGPVLVVCSEVTASVNNMERGNTTGSHEYYSTLAQLPYFYLG